MNFNTWWHSKTGTHRGHHYDDVRYGWEARDPEVIELDIKITRLEQRLKEAEEVIAFYANPIEWDYNGQGFGEFDSISVCDMETITETIHVGGKRAREYQEKYKAEG